MPGILFDTHEVITNLQQAGFSTPQAEAITQALKQAQDAGLHMLATKEDLRVATLELHQEISAVKTELRQEISAVKTELHQEIGDLKHLMQTMHQELKAEFATTTADIKGTIRLQGWMLATLSTLVIGVLMRILMR